MKKEILLLQNLMKERKIDYYIVPTTDYHGSEYVNPFFKFREYVSGFTGSAGTLLIGVSEAYLWTDGRYFLQGERQLQGSGINLMKSGQPGVPSLLEFLDEKLPAKGCLAFDGRLIDCCSGNEYAQLASKRNAEILYDVAFADEIWTSRPEIAPCHIYSIPEAVTGRSSGEKISLVYDALAERNMDFCLITSLEEIAWLFNLRGSDVANTPVFFAFCLMGPEAINLYVSGTLPDGFSDSINNAESTHTVCIKGYTEVFDDLKGLPPNSKILINDSQASYALFRSIPTGAAVEFGPSPIDLMKAVKNPQEIAATRIAHIKDGVAVVDFIHWLKQGVGQGNTVTEIDASDYLDNCRLSQDGCNDLSFPTIAGYGPNGAIIHYSATEDSNATLKPEGFLLVDSGGQYDEGTTDITRTIALGTLTREMQECYTAVLRSHLALAMAEFHSDTTGSDLDQVARKPLKDLGFDFNHGTGHGVGHLLSVHEGPNTISTKGDHCHIVPGMITSDEPGVYFEGRFGIRLENEILCVEKGCNRFGFDMITFAPFDRSAILPDMLTDSEREFLNCYHERVYETLKPHLTDELALWLKDETARI